MTLGRLVVDGHRDAAAAATAADRQTQRRLALRRFRQVKRNRPRRRLAVARRLGVVPILRPVALADDEIHVLRELLRILVVQAPHPILVAVSELLGTAVGERQSPTVACRSAPAAIPDPPRSTLLPAATVTSAWLNSPSTPSATAFSGIALPGRTLAILRAFIVGTHPELIILGVQLPIDWFARRGLGRQAHQHILYLRHRHQRIVDRQFATNNTAFIL